MSFSVEDEVKRKIDAWAKQSGISKSAVLRDLVKQREFEDYFADLHQEMKPVLAELGLKTDDDIYEYLESDETFGERKARTAAKRQKRT